jgi:nitrate reductase NapE component
MDAHEMTVNLNLSTILIAITAVGIIGFFGLVIYLSANAVFGKKIQ